MPSSSTARRDASGQKGQPGPDGAQGGPAGDGGMQLPLMPPVSLPRVHMPGGTAGNVLWWGGLAAVAAFGVVDWPVAALVAAVPWVAEQHAKQAARAGAAAQAG